MAKEKNGVPWKKIVDLYTAGKSTAEISDTLGLTRKKNQAGKENPYPYYLVVGYLTKLSHGVEVDGEKFKIVRGKRTRTNGKKKPAKAAKLTRKPKAAKPAPAASNPAEKAAAL